MHFTDNRKARKRKTCADVVKVTKAEPLILENKSSDGNEKDGENQLNLKKNKIFVNKG